MTERRAPRLAVLIDADNTSPRIAAGLFEEIAKIGEASVRRIYGDFSRPNLKVWADILAAYAIMPHQNFANTVGKNASDIALVIDAMDLLHSGRFDGFCLVSSDSDFTRLAARVREQGTDVYGFGEQKTPESFRQACRRFIYTENLLPEAPSADRPASKAALLPMGQAGRLIRTAIAQLDDASGWALLGRVGHQLAILASDFDVRSYGYGKLSDLVQHAEGVELKREPSGPIYVRLKPAKPSPRAQK